MPMGIKNIHLMLIFLSLLLCTVFGLWGINHNFQILGYVSFAVACGLAAYGINFLKKAKNL